MKTSVIRYRVADFLRDHPPFDLFSMEELLSISGTGRVIFHEDDIFLFRKDQAREPILWVIQQGKVELIDETPAGDHLRDVLGPGDILGLSRLSDSATYSHAARTATEVILYSFDLSAFESLVSKHPEAARFLTAHLSATSRHTKALQTPPNRERLLNEKEKTVWLNAPALPFEWIARRLVTCSPNLSASEAAKLMKHTPRGAIAVVTPDGHPVGLLTSKELCDFFADRTAMDDADAESLMDRSFRIAPPGLSHSEYLLEMLRNRRQLLAITADGSANSPLYGFVSDSDLAINCGRNPVSLMQGMRTAETVAELAYLSQRVAALLTETLVGPSVVEWLAQMLGELNAALVERIIEIAKAEMAGARRSEPRLSSCWLFFGEAGRQELLTQKAPRLGVIYADPVSAEAAEEAEAEKYFHTLIQKVAAKLQACGLTFQPGSFSTSQTADCRSLSAWKTFYSGLIHEPIANAIYSAREYFDSKTATGDRSLSSELENFILDELRRADSFIPILANDTIASLPPLTFFQDAIIDADGAAKKSFNVEKNALAPIIDSGRVLSLAERQVSISSTVQRLATSARTTPQYASILTDAAEGWRIVAYQCASAQLAQREEGALLHPVRLSRFEQRLLKSAFDSIRRLLELTDTIYSSPISP